MELTEKDFNIVLDEVKEASKKIATLIVENQSNTDSVQLYIKFNMQGKSEAVENYKLIATDEFIDISSDKNLFLLNSEPMKRIAIQQGLNLFELDNYKEKAKELTINMISTDILSKVEKELHSLEEMGLIVLTERNDEILKKLEKVGTDKAYQIFEKQFLNNASVPELKYETHPILEEITTSDPSALSEKYNLTSEELNFIQIASKLPLERIYELAEDYLDEKLIKAEKPEIKTLDEIKKEEGFDNAEKSILYLANIVSTIYDMNDIPYGETNEMTPENFKDAVENIVETFTSNKVSIMYLMQVMEDDGGMSERAMKITLEGFPHIQKNVENKNQMKFDFEAEPDLDVQPKVVQIKPSI